MFKLNTTLSIKIDGKEICGTLIGIDSYLMDAFNGKRVKWTSYTLVSKNKGAFARYWITQRTTGWFLSTATKKVNPPKGARVVPERSGIATIDFKGDKGVSTPSAALLAYKVGKDTYYTIERFLDSDVMFFDGIKIAKPIIVKP
jgi:hypothetical protein